MSELKTQVVEETTRQARLQELYLRNAPHALTTAYFLTGNRDLAEDLVQEAFVRVTGRFGHLRTPDAFPGYLRRTMVNLFTSQLRRRALERDWVQRQPTQIVTFEGEPEARDNLPTRPPGRR
jgi:RNA polymerase sigma factor (sigma-70 family)